MASENIYKTQFGDDYRRKIFIRNVYAIITLMKGFILSILATFTFSVQAYKIIDDYFWVLFSCSLSILIGVYIALCGNENVARSSPWNFVLLTVLYASLGQFFSCNIPDYGVHFITLSLAYIFLATFSIAVVVACYPSDVTSYGSLMCVMWFTTVISCFVTYIVFIYVLHDLQRSELLMGAGISLGYSAYLSTSTQHIMVSETFELSAREYTYGAIILVTNIANVYLCLLTLLDGKN